MAKIVQLLGPARADLVVAEVEERVPGAGEVRYRVHAYGLNRADLMAMEGTHYFLAEYPSRIGWEASGVVDAVGEGVTRFAIGDRVTAIPGVDFDHGTAGEYAITQEAFLIPWPEGYSAVEAASLCMQSFTAYYPVRRHLRIGQGDTVLVTAGSSSAAIGMTQLVKYLGGKVIASTRTGEKAAFLRRVGADLVVATDTEDLSARMLEFTDGKGVKAVYDCLGGDFSKRYLPGVAPAAKIFLYGAMQGMEVKFPLLGLVQPGAAFVGYSLINEVRESEPLEEAKSFISQAVAKGHLRPVIDRVFPFSQALDAYAYMETGVQRGKIVVEVVPS